MGWKIEDGVVTFVNPQKNSTNTDDWFKGLSRGIIDPNEIHHARLDNIPVHERRIKNAVTSR